MFAVNNVTTAFISVNSEGDKLYIKKDRTTCI